MNARGLAESALHLDIALHEGAGVLRPLYRGTARLLT